MTTFIAAVLALAVNARAAIHTETIEYKHEDKVLVGYLAYDDSMKGPRPGILIAHEWMGTGAYTHGRAEQLAKLGYVAFALDMYGKDVHPANHEEAGKLAGSFRADRALMRARARAGLDVLKARPEADPKRLAAIGYCFGGGAMLELALDGADLKGVAVFHAPVDTPNPGDAKNIKGKILVMEGGDDAWISTESVKAFKDGMRQAKIDWQLVFYGGAVHSFTVPTAGDDPSKGMAYNAAADHRSWLELQNFLKEIF